MDFIDTGNIEGKPVAGLPPRRRKGTVGPL